MKLVWMPDYKKKHANDYPRLYTGEESEFDARIARIQASLYRINQLMRQLKTAAEQAEQNQND